MKTRAFFLACTLLTVISGSANAATIPGLVAFWPLQSTNGASTPDIVGGYNFQLSGTSGRVPTILGAGGSPGSHMNGETGRTMQFTGSFNETCQYFAGAADFLPLNKNSQFTICFWVNGTPPGTPSGASVFSESLSANNNLLTYDPNQFFLFGTGTNSSNILGHFQLHDTTGQDGLAQSPPISFSPNQNVTQGNVFDGTWHFVAITLSNGLYKVYMDGSLDTGSGGALDSQGHPTALKSLPQFNTLNNSPWQWDLDTTCIGGIAQNVPGTNGFTGMMDNVAVFNRALASNEIAQAFNSGVVAYYSVTINPGMNALANQLNNSSNTLSVLLTQVSPGDAVYTYSLSNGYSQAITFTTNGWFDGGIEGGGPPSGPSIPAGTAFFLYNSGAAYTQVFSGMPSTAGPTSVFCGNTYALCRPNVGIGTFENMTGQSPQEADEVFVYIGTGESTPSTIQNQFDYSPFVFIGGGWVPNPPQIPVGQSVFVRHNCTNNSCVQVNQGDMYLISSGPARPDFQPSGTDFCGAGVAAYSRPPPGTFFPLGTTPARAVAIDDLGNYAVTDFTVTVAPPPQQPPTGEYDLNLPAGLSLIAFQFGTVGNTLNETIPFVPDGTVLTKFDNSAQRWVQSIYSGSLGAWVPPQTFFPGQGAFINLPTSFDLSLTGNIISPTLPISLNEPILLVSRQTNAPGNYTNITGMSPTAGTKIFKWNGSGYDIYFFNGTTWIPSEPTNAVGEAWWISPTGSTAPPNIPDRPVITSPPSSQTASLGTGVTLAVTATGTSPFSYLWRLNGNAIPGATDSQYSISSLTVSNCGNYDVLVYNIIGITNSHLAQVGISGVSTLSFGNTFSSAGSLPSTTSGFGVMSNFNGIVESNEPSPAFIPGGAPVWVTWTAPTTGVATFSTAGSGLDTLLAIYSGNSLSSLTSVASDDDSAGYLWSSATFNATSGTTYHIQVDGFYGAVGNILLSWNEMATFNQIPVITNQPIKETVSSGDTATFHVAVAPGFIDTFQWLRNGTALTDGPSSTGTSFISGSTTSTLSISNVGVGDVGSYQVTVMNTSGGLSTTTFPAELQINSTQNGPATPGVLVDDKFLAESDTNIISNDPYDPAIASGYTGVQIFGMFGATVDPGEPLSCGAPCVCTKWFSFLTNSPNFSSGILTYTDTNTPFSAVLAVYTGNPANYPSLVPVDCSTGHAPGQEAVTFQAFCGTTYWIVIGSTNPADANSAVHVQYSFITPPLFTTLPTSQSVQLNGSVSLTAAATGYPPPGYQWMRNSANVMNATSTSLSLGPFQNTTQGNYSIVATNAAGTNLFNFTPIYLNSPLQLVNPSQINGTFYMQLVGQVNSNYVIQASSHLPALPAAWTNVSTNSSATGISQIQYPTNGGNIFYRARTLAPVN